METATTQPTFLFCLGGHDLEMLAAASACQPQINEALQLGTTPVLIELHDDLAFNSEQLILIDHHGRQAGKTQPTALHQVFQLLDLPASRWTRWFELVAANDVDHIAGLQALNATQAEIIKVREADRRAQGITAADDAEAQKALAAIEIKADGALSIVHLTHQRTTAVVDALHPALGLMRFPRVGMVAHCQRDVFGAMNR